MSYFIQVLHVNVNILINVGHKEITMNLKIRDKQGKVKAVLRDDDSEPVFDQDVLEEEQKKEDKLKKDIKDLEDIKDIEDIKDVKDLGEE